MKPWLSLFFVSTFALADCTLTCELVPDAETGESVFFWNDGSPGQCGENSVCFDEVGTEGCSTETDLGKNTEGTCIELPPPNPPSAAKRLHR